MRADLLVLGITVFLVFNTYHDGKYTKLFHIKKKYMQMALYGFVGLSLVLFIKKNPKDSKSMFSHANNIIKYMPIDKNTSDMLSPIFDFTAAHEKIGSMGEEVTPQYKRMLNSGGNSSKRSVSETKKKYVASEQNWCCAHCKEQLSESDMGKKCFNCKEEVLEERDACESCVNKVIQEVDKDE